VSITRSTLHAFPRCMLHMIVRLGPAPRADVMHQPPKSPLYHSDLQKRHCTPGYTCREHRYVERHACRPSVMWSMRELSHSHIHTTRSHTTATTHTTDTRTHACTHVRICTRIRVLTMHFFTHARARTHTHTHTHAHTHTHRVRVSPSHEHSTRRAGELAQRFGGVPFLRHHSHARDALNRLGKRQDDCSQSTSTTAFRYPSAPTPTLLFARALTTTADRQGRSIVSEQRPPLTSPYAKGHLTFL
jgi:hypothetical protein